MKKQKGITLIALIITIIVMLILVAIVINFVMNDNGIITNSKTASERTRVEIDRESLQDYVLGRDVYDAVTGEVDLGVLAGKLETADWTVRNSGGRLEVIGKQSGETFTITQNGTIKVEQEGGTSGGETVSGMKSYDQASKDANGYLTENAKYTSGSDVAVIPQGFKVSEEEGEQTISGGLVIQDEAENEFVWIPVANPVLDLSEEEENDNSNTIGGIDRNELIDLIENELETGKKYMAAKLADEHYYGITYNFNENGDCEFRGVDNLTVKYTGSEEYDPVVQSVCDYKGFYVGRYMTTEDLELNTVVSKSGKNIALTNWNNIDNKQKNFKNEATDSVQSSTIYGFQYDQVMMFVNGNGFNVGALAQNIGPADIITGRNEEHKNIYDLVFYGGCYTNEITGKAELSTFRGLKPAGKGESQFVVAGRMSSCPYNRGTRLSLYIK